MERMSNHVMRQAPATQLCCNIQLSLKFQKHCFRFATDSSPVRTEAINGDIAAGATPYSSVSTGGYLWWDSGYMGLQTERQIIM